METVVIQVYETFNVYGISAKDVDIWKNICRYVAQYPKEQQVILDFKGVLLTEAWKNKYFTNILRLENVILRVYHSSEMKRDVDDICNLCDLGDDRIINIGTVELVETEPDQGIKRRIVDKLVKACTVQEQVLSMDFGRVLHSLEKTDVIVAMKVALDEVLPEHEAVTKIKVDFGYAVINESVLDLLFTELKPYVDNYGLEFDTISYKSELKLHMLKHKKSTVAEKATILDRELPTGAVVMLTKYMTSRTKDNLGRYGNGLTDWCHMAIYRGIENEVAVFDDFMVSDFHTQAHKVVEGLPQDAVQAEKLTIPLSALGFWEEFLGSQYHCNYLVQFTHNESVREWVEIEQDKAEMQTLILPEFARIVLDENQIVYNKEHLQEVIDYTQELLNRIPTVS